MGYRVGCATVLKGDPLRIQTELFRVASYSLGVIPGPGLLFGLVLVSAIVGGYAARLIHVPRVVGFLLGGTALRLLLHEVLDVSDDAAKRQALEIAAEPLRVIRDVALGLILFNIGGALDRTKLRAVGPRLLKISALETGLVLVFVLVGCGLVALATQAVYGGTQNLVLAILLGVAAIATAPAATAFVLQEYQAKGPITDTILGLTAANNIVCIVAFHSIFLVLASFGALNTTGSLAQHVWLALGFTTLGSIVLGIAAGTVISVIHAKLPIAETLLVFFALFIILGAGQQWLLEHQGLSYNFLLTSLVIGAVFTNVAVDSQRLESSLQTVGTPIFAGFFVISGYSFHTTDLAHMGLLGGAYIVCRYMGKAVGCRLGARWAGGPERADGRLGPALLCQAAVVIGLASFVERYWQSELASQFSVVVLGSVVVFELTGPFLLKRCVVQAGEVKAITLLRRGPTSDVWSLTRVTLQSLGRLFGLQMSTRSVQRKQLLVEHIMRTNVQFIKASATFEEALHAIERSTYSHFPVIHDDGTFAGVIHFSDVRDVIYDPTLSGLITAVDLAASDSMSVPTNMPLTELLKVFTVHNVAVLPVAECGASHRIVGIVEQRDLLRALHLSKETQ